MIEVMEMRSCSFDVVTLGGIDGVTNKELVGL